VVATEVAVPLAYGIRSALVSADIVGDLSFDFAPISDQQLGQIYEAIESEEAALYARGSFRKETYVLAEANAPRNVAGEMICETCGQVLPDEIILETKDGYVFRIGYDLDHLTVWAKTIKELKARLIPPTRQEVLDLYNENVRVLCPPCNVSHLWEGIPGPYAHKH
jgi:hypothetical protein